FKHSQHLRVGVRDILGKDEIQATHAELSDIAEASLKYIISLEAERLEDKMGMPTIAPPAEGVEETPSRWHPGSERAGDFCGMIVLALGKLGGREPNYHSDLDLVFLYEADGQT